MSSVDFNDTLLLQQQNASNSTAVMLRSFQWFTVWIFVTLTICAIGSLLFLFVIIAFFAQKKGHGGSTLLLLHLFVLEFLICAVHGPISSIMIFLTQNDIFPNQACPQFNVAYVTTFGAGLWSSLFLAISRFTASLIPHHYKHLITKRAMAAMIIFSWTISICCNLPGYFGIGAQIAFRTPYGICATRPERGGHLYPALSAISMYVPLVLTVLVYLLLFCKTALNTGHRVGTVLYGTGMTQNRAEGRMARRRILLAKMLFVSSLWYCACLLPGGVMAGYFSHVVARNTAAQLWIKTVFLCGYAMTPVIVFSLNIDYRKGLRLVFSRIGVVSSVTSTVVPEPDGTDNQKSQTAVALGALPNHKTGAFAEHSQPMK